MLLYGNHIGIYAHRLLGKWNEEPKVMPFNWIFALIVALWIWLQSLEEEHQRLSLTMSQFDIILYKNRISEYKFLYWGLNNLNKICWLILQLKYLVTIVAKNTAMLQEMMTLCFALIIITLG